MSNNSLESLLSTTFITLSSSVGIAKSIYSAIPYDVFVYDSCAHGNLTEFFCFLQALTV